jgi:hypothetical protein
MHHYIDTICVLQQKVAELEMQLYKRTERPDYDSWTGKDFVRLFNELYSAKYGSPYPDQYRSPSYAATRTTSFLNSANVSLAAYHRCITYIFNDDPLVQGGMVPSISWLWNASMIRTILGRVRRQVVSHSTPQLKGASSSKLGMSDEDIIKLSSGRKSGN